MEVLTPKTTNELTFKLPTDLQSDLLSRQIKSIVDNDAILGNFAAYPKMTVRQTALDLELSISKFIEDIFHSFSFVQH